MKNKLRKIFKGGIKLNFKNMFLDNKIKEGLSLVGNRA
jgi:hypothetical protein